MSITTDLIDRADAAKQARSFWEGVWGQIANLALPTEQTFAAMGRIAEGLAGGDGPRSTRRVKGIYDNTGMWTIDRLASGMESLVTPQSEKWHDLGPTDPLAPEATDEEREWYAKFRDFLFVTRYDPKAGFISAHQKAMRSCIAFGTGVVYIEENFGKRGLEARQVPKFYRYTPLAECMLATNDMGVVDSNFRYYTLTARQLAQKFGEERLSPKVQQMLKQATRLDETVECLHAVCPREEIGSRANLGNDSSRGSPWASYYIEKDTRHLISEGGFFEFPFMVYHWLQQDNGPYAESPVMLALSEIKGLNIMGKNELRAFQQFTDPPLALPNSGVMNPPNMNPRANNFGAMGEDGKLRVAPLITVREPQFAEQIMDVRRNAVKETMYVNLFQILIKNPEMTATEAMIRANEKGELLGPAGGKIQHGLAQGIDREIGILERKGAFMADSPLAPPESLGGRGVGVRFTSPLDRLRRANEGVGIQRLLEVVAPLAKIKPNVADNLDFDEIVRQLATIWNAPPSIITRRDELEEMRNVGDRKQQAAEAAGLAVPASDAMKNIATASKVGGEAALQSPQIMDALNEILQRLRSTSGKVADRGEAGPGAVEGVDALLSQFGEPAAPRGLAPPAGAPPASAIPSI